MYYKVMGHSGRIAMDQCYSRGLLHVVYFNTENTTHTSPVIAHWELMEKPRSSVLQHKLGLFGQVAYKFNAKYIYSLSILLHTTYRNTTVITSAGSIFIGLLHVQNLGYNLPQQPVFIKPSRNIIRSKTSADVSR